MMTVSCPASADPVCVIRAERRTLSVWKLLSISCRVFLPCQKKIDPDAHTQAVAKHVPVPERKPRTLWISGSTCGVKAAS